MIVAAVQCQKIWAASVVLWKHSAWVAAAGRKGWEHIRTAAETGKSVVAGTTEHPGCATMREVAWVVTAWTSAVGHHHSTQPVSTCHRNVALRLLKKFSQ